MIIQDGFYLSGFTRVDLGETGAVFLQYEESKETRKPEIRETPMYYGGANTTNFTLSIPKPKPRNLVACAIVTRTSKNCYQATAFGKKRIEYFRSDTLDGLRHAVATFFKE